MYISIEEVSHLPDISTVQEADLLVKVLNVQEVSEFENLNISAEQCDKILFYFLNKDTNKGRNTTLLQAIQKLNPVASHGGSYI